MGTQLPDDFQGNQKSTSSKQIAPGDPMWTGNDIHDQQSFGWGYDYHDPIDLLKGDKKLGGYQSGNAATNFGAMAFEAGTMQVEHGHIVNLIIKREGGISGTADLVIELDRDPFGTGVDPNTGILGNGRTRVVDGFDVCEVDLDVETLNINNNDIIFDEFTQTLNVKVRPGVRETRIPMIVAYRTKVNHMEPAKVIAPFTYRVDEYRCHNMVTDAWPPMTFLTEHKDCVPDGTDGVLSTRTSPHTLQYNLLSLQVPTKFTESTGGITPIDAYTTHLVNRFDKTGRSYNIGQTYTAESQAIIRQDASWSGSACNAAINEVHNISTYNLTAGFYTVTFPDATVMDILEDTTFGGLTATIDPTGNNIYSTTSGITPLTNTPLSSADLIIEYAGPTMIGQNITDLVVDATDANPLGTPAGGQELTATVITDGDPGSMGTTLCSCLSALENASGIVQNYGVSVVVDTSGNFKDYDKTDIDPAGQLQHTYANKTAALPIGIVGSQWITHPVTQLGDAAPDTTGGVPELNPGDPTASPPVVGQSDIRVNALDDYLYGYADLSHGFGDTVDVLFDGEGIPNTFSEPLIFKPKYTSPLASSPLHNFPEGNTVPKWPTSKSLSAAGYFWEINNDTSAGKGHQLTNQWIIDDPGKVDILYDITNLAINPDNYNLNKSRLAGYYMTCDDHLDREVHLKIYPKDAEPNFDMGTVQKIKVEIGKSSRYDVLKHAVLDPDQIDATLMMRHLSATGLTYKDNDEIGKPTGDSLMDRLFSPFAPMSYDATLSAWYATGMGCLSTDDIAFLSVVEGYKANDARSRGGKDAFQSPPVFKVDEALPIERDVTTGVAAVVSVEYSNSGAADMTLTFENSVESVSPPTAAAISFSYNTGLTDAVTVGSNQWSVPPGKKVVVKYETTPNGTAGELITFKHQVQVDYIGFPPGISTEDIDFTLSIT
jgi:hypothetical protein